MALKEPSEEARQWRLIAFAAIGIILLICLIQGARSLKFGSEKPDEEAVLVFDYELAKFEDLTNWRDDDQKAAIQPFLLSCEKMANADPSAAANPLEALGVEPNISLSGTNADWLPACDAAKAVLQNGDARQFFEEAFQPVKIIQREEERPHKLITSGLFTGYFEPAYPASYEKTEVFSVPVLSRPEDLVMVDLGAFREDLAGQRIAGRVQGGRLKPFESHQEIIEQGLDVEVLAWMDPNDLLFLQIQGSGKLLINDEVLRVGYAGQNGHPYTPIGRPLIQQGHIALEDMSMQAIYSWLEAAEETDASAIRYTNRSYVFFRSLRELRFPFLGPVGAGNTQLTAGRSLAVDRRYYAMGTPVWLSYDGVEEGEVISRLMIAQDTGGAIRGPIRGDVFVGSGAEAGAVAGKMRQSGELYILLPKSVAQKLES